MDVELHQTTIRQLHNNITEKTKAKSSDLRGSQCQLTGKAGIDDGVDRMQSCLEASSI